MTAFLARPLMTLAECCLGTGRREWALAMRSEFDMAVAAGKPLAFASGCLLAAVREMPRHEEGRFVLTNHLLTLGLLIPIAGLQLLCAVGAAFPKGGALYAVAQAGSTQAAYQADAYRAAVPLLLGLWLIMCVGHLRLAWAMLESDWQRVIRIGSLISAGAVTLLIFTGVLLVGDARELLQVGILPIELAAIAALARWQTRLFSGETLGQPTV